MTISPINDTEKGAGEVTRYKQFITWTFLAAFISGTILILADKLFDTPSFAFAGMLPTHKGLKLQLNYNVFGMANFSLAFFVFGVSNNGFFWDALLFLSGLMVASSVLFTLNYLISLGTATYLKHRKVSLPPLLSQRIIQHFNRKTALKKGATKGNKEDPNRDGTRATQL